MLVKGKRSSLPTTDAPNPQKLRLERRLHAYLLLLAARTNERLAETEFHTEVTNADRNGQPFI